MERAVETYDHFPSIAQLRECWENPASSEPKTWAPPPIEPVERFPWPMPIMGLIEGFNDPRGVSKFGLHTLGLTLEEAKFLYECRLAGKWDEPWAREIIAKSKTGAFEARLKNFGGSAA